MSWLDTPQLQELERYINLVAVRQSLIAGNIANVDTPHYRTLDVDFQKELQRAMSEPLGADRAAQPAVHQVKGLVEAPDGNNVSMDRESMLLAQTQLQYRIGIQLLRDRYHILLSAINEGK